MAGASLLAEEYAYLGVSNSQDELFSYLLSEDSNLPSLVTGPQSTESFLLEPQGTDDEELLAASSPYGNSSSSSSDSSPSFSQNLSSISYDDQLAFNQLWSELAAYGSNAEDPQAFAQSLLAPPQSNEYTPESSPEVDEDGLQNNSKKRKRIRKRTKKEEGPFEPTAVSLPRDKLLVLSSKEMQQYVDEIRRTRPLTGEEERDIKRQKRLIKNRESALASRTRKKAHVEVLQQQINDISKEKEEMNEGLNALAAENEGLKQQVHHLQNVIRKTSFLSELWEKMTNSKRQQVRMDPSSTTATATACLFVILFTFGLFFDPVPSSRLGQEKPSLADAFNGVSFVEESTAPTPISASSNTEYPSFRTHRKLLETDEMEDVALLSSTTTTTTTSSDSSSTSSTSSSTSTSSTWIEDDDMRKPLNGSNYFLCSTPHHVSITLPSAQDASSSTSTISLPTLVTFFLPADLVRQTMLTLAQQVSCQMLDAASIARFTSLVATTTSTSSSSSSYSD